MIYSMTAFARIIEQSDYGTITWEIRSVNNRNLDCFIKLPEVFRQLEMEIRDRIRRKINRGRIDCMLHYKPEGMKNVKLVLNTPLVKELSKTIEELNNHIAISKTINPMQILSWPEVLVKEEEEIEELHNLVLKVFDKLVEEFLEVRKREGKELVQFIEEKLNSVLVITAKVKPLVPNILANQKAKLLTKLDEIKAELDLPRLEHEMVYFAQKIDILEEIERLETHVKESKFVLKNGGNVGKKLDFLMQELNREANTLASKSVDSETSALAIELKVLIEQMREQIQNLE